MYADIAALLLAGLLQGFALSKSTGWGNEARNRLHIRKKFLGCQSHTKLRMSLRRRNAAIPAAGPSHCRRIAAVGSFQTAPRLKSLAGTPCHTGKGKFALQLFGMRNKL